jgi:RNA polymerase sigma factor (sigma-70 family)
MKSRKTHRDDRGTYKYVHYHTVSNGRYRKEVVELKPGVDGVTELDIRMLHQADDREVYHNSKNLRPERTKKEKEKIKEWEEQYRKDFKNEHGYLPHPDDVLAEINERFPRNYHLSLNAFDDECEEGKNPIQALIATEPASEDPRVERLREVVERLTPYHQQLYQMLVTDQMTQVEVAAELGVSKQAINKTWKNIQDKIKKLF